MASKELIEKVAREMTSTLRHHGVELHPEDIRGISQDAISTILAALHEPNAEMINALWSVNSSRGWPEAAKTCWQSAINASPLGEQSDG